MIRRLLRSLWAECLFGNFRWCRRMYGGHWECWYVEYVHADIWHRVSRCSLESGERPTPLCRGTPTCEHHAPVLELPQGQAYRSLAP